MKKDIDQLIKGKIEGYEEPFDTAAWEKMNTKLDQQNGSNKKVWYWSAAALFIGIGIGVLAVRQLNQPIAGSSNSTITSSSLQTIEVDKNQINTVVESNQTNANIQSNQNSIQQLETIHQKTSSNDVNEQIKQEASSKQIAAISRNQIEMKASKNITKETTASKIIATKPIKDAEMKAGKVEKEKEETATKQVLAENKQKTIVAKKGKPIASKSKATSITTQVSNSTAAEANGMESHSVISTQPTAAELAEVETTNSKEVSKAVNEQTITTENQKVLQVIGEVPASDASKEAAEKQLLAMAVKKAEDTPVTLPRPKKVFKPTWAVYAGVGTSLTSIDQNRKDGHIEQHKPQFEAQVQISMGILKRKQIPMLEFLTGLGFNSFNYSVRANGNSLIQIDDSTQLQAFSYRYNTLSIPLAVKFNFVQTNHVTCYVKLTWGNHLVFNKNFQDEVNIIPIPITGNNAQHNIQQNQYGTEDFKNQRPDERFAKLQYFNDRSYFSTMGVGLGMHWRWLFAEVNYMIEPQIMRNNNKHNFGILTGLRIPLTK